MDHGAHEGEHSCCSHQKAASSAWFQTPWVLFSLVSAALLALSFWVPKLEAFRGAFYEYLRMMALPIASGLVAGGLIDRFIPAQYVSKHLASQNRRSVFYAAGLGFLMSACSHGILALSMEFHKKGASGPAVVSFLLASPWANLPVTFLLVGFFGWRGALIILAALLVAILTGLLFQALDRKGWIEKNVHTRVVAHGFSVRRDLARRFKDYRFTAKGFAEDLRGVWTGMAGLAGMVVGWLLLGILLASLAAALVPHELFERYLGPTPAGLLITLALATVLEVCSEGTAPLAFEIYRRTGALGNAFAFLMGGVVTDYTEVGLVWSNIGKKTALWMLILTIPQVLLLGLIFNRFLM